VTNHPFPLGLGSLGIATAPAKQGLRRRWRKDPSNSLRSSALDCTVELCSLRTLAKRIVRLCLAPAAPITIAADTPSGSRPNAAALRAGCRAVNPQHDLDQADRTSLRRMRATIVSGVRLPLEILQARRDALRRHKLSLDVAVVPACRDPLIAKRFVWRGARRAFCRRREPPSRAKSFPLTAADRSDRRNSSFRAEASKLKAPDLCQLWAQIGLTDPTPGYGARGADLDV